MSDKNSIKLIPTPDPFDFSLALEYLNRSPLECMHFVSQGGVSKMIRVGKFNYIIEITMADMKHLTVQIQWTNASQISWPKILEYVRHWFDLDTNLMKVYEVFNKSELLKPLIVRFNGLRILGIPDLFEVICWAIIGQQINLAFAYQVKKNFVTRYGESIDCNDQRFYLFPSPSSVLKISAAEWKDMKFSRQKARYIQLLAEQLISGELSKSKLANLDPVNIKLELLKLVGIGEWSAEYVRMRCFHIGSAFPMTDAGLHQALKASLSLDRKPTREELEALSVQWHPWQSYSTFYLWRTLH